MAKYYAAFWNKIGLRKNILLGYQQCKSLEAPLKKRAIFKTITRIDKQNNGNNRCAVPVG